MTEIVEVLIDGGEASPGPPLGPTLGPMGVNIMKIAGDINKKTAAFKGMKVPVKITIADDKSYEIEVGTHDNEHGDYTRCQNFLDAVFEDAPLIAPLEDAIRTSELLHAIRDSHDHEIRVPVHWQGKTG